MSYPRLAQITQRLNDTRITDVDSDSNPPAPGWDQTPPFART